MSKPETIGKSSKPSELPKMTEEMADLQAKLNKKFVYKDKEVSYGDFLLENNRLKKTVKHDITTSEGIKLSNTAQRMKEASAAESRDRKIVRAITKELGMNFLLINAGLIKFPEAQGKTLENPALPVDRYQAVESFSKSVQEKYTNADLSLIGIGSAAQAKVHSKGKDVPLVDGSKTTEARKSETVSLVQAIKRRFGMGGRERGESPTRALANVQGKSSQQGRSL